MQQHAGSFDFILDTCPAEHDLNAYLSLLKLDGTLILVGAPAEPLPLVAGLQPDLWAAAASPARCIGGIAETQEMLDFCAEHGIVCDIEIDPDPEDQRGLRAAAEGRREVPLRHRHEVPTHRRLIATRFSRCGEPRTQRVPPAEEQGE